MTDPNNKNQGPPGRRLAYKDTRTKLSSSMMLPDIATPMMKMRP
jgi:hypothetical protein